MPSMTWRLSDWLGTCKKGIRHRRRPLSRRAPAASAERLEGRALLAGNAIVSGVTFIDANSNTLKDTGEVAARGIVMTLSNVGGTAFNETVTTDANGKFSFFRVPAGTYTLTADPGAQLTGSAVPVAVEVDDEFDTVTKDIALGGLKPAVLSLRQFLNTSTTATLPLEAAGSGRNGNEIPTVLGAVSLDVSFTTASQTPKTVDLAGIFTDQDFENSEVQFRTSVGVVAGNINVELFDEEAPITVANFYEYANSGRYNDTIFHRLIDDFVLQGGGFSFDDATDMFSPVSTDPTIQNEFNATTRSNFANTIAMAKVGGDQNSASSQFFFNLADNRGTSPLGLNFQNGGFTVFGKIAGSTPTADGTVTNSVLLNLADTDTSNRSSTNSSFGDLPLENYLDETDPTETFPTDATPENFLRILGIDTVRRNEVLSYSLMSGDSPVEVIDTTLFTAVIENHRLKVTPMAGQSGQAEIVVRATDLAGESVTTTFRVHVVPVGNDAPTTTVALNPTLPVVNSTLTATATTPVDGDGDPVSLTYVWKVGSTVVRTQSKSASDPTLTTDTLDLTTISTEAVGNVITVEVTPNDGFVDGTKVTATRTLVASNSAPTATVALTPDSPTVNSVLTATATTADVNGQTVKLTYVWKVGSKVVKTTPATTTLTDTLDLSTIGTEVPGNNVTVEVTPNDGTVNGAKVTATRVLVNSAPTVTVALSPESPFVNSVLTAKATAADVDGQPVKLTYVWKVGSTVVKTTSATTSRTNTLDLRTIGIEVAGDNITVEVTPNDGTVDGTKAIATRVLASSNSAPTATVALSPNNPRVNSVLTATATAADVNGQPVKLTYVWKVGSTVVKTTSATTSLTNTLDLRTISTEAVGSIITVEVTPFDGLINGTLVSASKTIS